MDDRIPALIFGSLLILGGSGLLWWHVRGWRARQRDTAMDDRERRHYQRQYRRRMQSSGLIVAIGVLMPVGDALIPWQEYPAWFAVYWMAILGMAFWVMLLGVGDLFATRSHAAAAISKLRDQQRALELEAAKLKARATNGRDQHL